ncbi:MAG: winged helix-turn-helix domain-containing protein [Oligoflexia bacterium]|nr:winged helix-turn-helix domain-containing protein [Oligoflexia bacterium]
MNQVEKPQVWILDNNKNTSHTYQQALDDSFDFKEFSNINDFREYYLNTLRSNKSRIPDFIISELYLDDGCMIDLFRDPNFPKNTHSQFFIVSQEKDPSIIENCLKFGASDFFAKPVALPVLQAKLNFALQEKIKLEKQDVPVLKANTLTFYKNDSFVTTLTPKEIRIFSILHEAKGDTVTRDQIVSTVWNNKKTCNKSFDVHLFNLRKKLWALDIEVDFVPPNSYRLEKGCALII